MSKLKWICCPMCGKHLQKVYEGRSVLRNVPLYCKQCRVSIIQNYPDSSKNKNIE